jgi:hypothetical protein
MRCPEYKHIPAPRRPEWWRCPKPGVVNMIVWARRNGMLAIDVSTLFSPGAERAARDAGLGQHYTGAPPRESIHLGNYLRNGVVVNEALLNPPSSWTEPPETVTIDVNKSIRDGRITACTPQDRIRTRSGNNPAAWSTPHQAAAIASVTVSATRWRRSWLWLT